MIWKFFYSMQKKGYKNMTRKQKKMLVRIIIAALMIVIFAFLPIKGVMRFTVYMIPYLVVGYDILRKAFKGILNRQVFDECFLMAIATIGAMVIAVSSDGDYTEAIAVMLFYQIGELFQSYAVGKSRRNISELMDIRPDYANVSVNGELKKVSPEEVEIGSIVVVQPGEKVPIDGIVLEGDSDLDTSALTGESVPSKVREGDEIISGCINMTGVLKIRTTKNFGESTVSKILELVENASFRKSKSEKFISRFARYYTPAVCCGALTLAIVPPVFRILIYNAPALWGEWIYRALTFLVISCPCALVISIPLSFFAGIGGASHAGILIKGSNYIETLSKVDCVVMDKTGTLTEGVFDIQEVHSNIEESKLIEYATLAESASSHPISKSLKKLYGKEADRDRVSEIKELSGHGVIAKVDGISVAVGNDKLMKHCGVKNNEIDSVGTVAHIAIGGEYAGYIIVADAIKRNSIKAIESLKKAGIKKIVMLTGDTEAVAKSVATKLGIKEVYSKLLPENKVEKVEALLAKESGVSKLAFVGDGINDAPVLSRADVGIAMGAMGSDAAIEAADVVLMDDDPLKIAKAISISRKCIGIVYQNIIFAIGVKLVCLIMGALGMTNMWIAIFADVGVMVIAVLNAIRALFVDKI